MRYLFGYKKRVAMKNKALVGVALSFLLPISANANSCEPNDLGGYTIGAFTPVSEVEKMRCNDRVLGNCVTRQKKFSENGLNYVVHFRSSDGVVYEIEAEKKASTLEDYEHFLGLITNNIGTPSADGGFVAYNRKSMSNGLFTTERKKRIYVADMKFACWGDCETKAVDEKNKKHIGNHAYAPTASTSYVQGTLPVKADGLFITFNKKEDARRSELKIKATCEELAADVKSDLEKAKRTGRY